MPEGTLTLNDTELTDEEMSEMQRGLDSDLQRLVYPFATIPKSLKLMVNGQPLVTLQTAHALCLVTK